MRNPATTCKCTKKQGMKLTMCTLGFAPASCFAAACRPGWFHEQLPLTQTKDTHNSLVKPVDDLGVRQLRGAELRHDRGRLLHEGVRLGAS